MDGVNGVAGWLAFFLLLSQWSPGRCYYSNIGKERKLNHHHQHHHHSHHHHNHYSGRHHYEENDESNNDGPQGLYSRSSGYKNNCRLPGNWNGNWFQLGIPTPIVIDNTSIQHKGKCRERSGDKFLFVDKSIDCYRCVVINERHQNVLEYKESSFCEEKNSLEELCRQIPGDAVLYSLFRIDAEPIPCPFKGPFTFTYDKGDGECGQPVSHVDTCTQPSRLLLRYESCPNILRTESMVEELECLAVWSSGAYYYFVGKLQHRRFASNEESYRCFIFNDNSRNREKADYQIAQSGDASCAGISNPKEGARTFTFRKVTTRKPTCIFPRWFTSHHWHTLNGKTYFKSRKKNTTILVTMSVTSDRRISESGVGFEEQETSEPSEIQGVIYPQSNKLSEDSFRLFSDGAEIECETRHDLLHDHVAIVARHKSGCRTTKVCLHLYKRDPHVAEIRIQEKKSSYYEDYECSKMDETGNKLPFLTVISSSVLSHKCPYFGRYMASGITKDGSLIADLCSSTSVTPHGAFHTLVVGCANSETMEFHSQCVAHDPITSYQCHGNWNDEDGLGYLIASPLSRSSTSPKRYCFMYSETEEGLQVFSSRENCDRNRMSAVDDVWAFNLTIEGHCAEAMTGISSKIAPGLIMPIFIPTLGILVVYLKILIDIQCLFDLLCTSYIYHNKNLSSLVSVMRYIFVKSVWGMNEPVMTSCCQSLKANLLQISTYDKDR